MSGGVVFYGERRMVRLIDVRQLYRLACRLLLGLLSADDRRLPGRAEEGIWNMATDIIARAQEEEHLRPRTRHRALPDAEGLWWTWRAVQDAVDRHIEAGG